MTDVIQYSKDADGIVTLSIDMPDRVMNVLNETLNQPFADTFAKLEAETDLKGVILTSGKEDFVVGADLDQLYNAANKIEAFNFIQEFKKSIKGFWSLGVPVVAAINGTALGGGFELALSGHYRICINNPRKKIGLPEAKLGLFPGGGATQVIPRLIGLQAALPIMLEGRQMNPEKALKTGLIHELAADRDDMMAKAKAWIQANPNAKQPWEEKKFRWPDGAPQSPQKVQMLAIGPSMINQKTWRNYPNATNILAAIYEGSVVDMDSALEIESRYLAETVCSPVAKAMIGTFWYQMNKVNKGESRPDGFDASKVSKVGILGAGMMGAGIAYASARAGIDVVLKDVSAEGAANGKAYSEKLLAKAKQRGKINAEKMQSILDRITPTDDAADLAGCDLIIEAVFEDRELKAKVTQEAEAVMDAGGVFASNTSTLPITGLAEASARPDKFIGLHFFSPVDKMPLVEIILGKETSDETLARAFDYVQQIKKTPIVVNDSRGFYTSRVFATYINEGMAMLAEGVHPRAVEVMGLAAGMPVGPLALTDEVSLSLGHHILEQTRKDMAAAGETMVEHPASAVMEKMVVELDRPGKKAGKGFYDYPGDGKKKLWPGLAEQWPVAEQQPERQELIDRLLYIQANETARCMEENVVMTVPDANIGSIFGWGFAPWAGGTLQYIRMIGIKNFVERSEDLAKKYGERFAPAKLLQDMAKRGEEFPQD